MTGTGDRGGGGGCQRKMWGEGCQALKNVCHQRHRRHRDVYVCLREPFSIRPPGLCIPPESLHLLPTKTEPLATLTAICGAISSLPSPRTFGEGWGAQRRPNATNVHTRQSTLSELPSIFNLLAPRENNNCGEGEGGGWVRGRRNRFSVGTIICDSVTPKGTTRGFMKFSEQRE